MSTRFNTVVTGPARTGTIARLAAAFLLVLLLAFPVHAATVNYVQTAVNDVDGSTVAAVASDQ